MYNNSNMQSMYPPQPQQQQQPPGGGGGWGDPNNTTLQQQPFAGYAYPQTGPDASSYPPVSSASLFQQQLAQQQRQLQQNPPPPPLQQQQQQPPFNAANAYQSSAQAYMQSQQQLAQARQGVQPQHMSPAAASPPAQSSPFPAQQQRPMTGQEIMTVLRGVNIQGMNPQIFATLSPIQQHAVREFIARSRMYQAQQQAQLGLGLPGSPSAPSPSSQKPPNQQILQQPHAPPPPAPVAANGSPLALAAGGNTNVLRPPPTPASASSAPASTPSQTQIGFLKILGDFCSKRGIPFAATPVVEGRSLELPRLYAAVNATGGFVNTNARRQWGTVATTLGFQAASADEHPESRLEQIASAYRSVLYPFEQHVAQIQLERVQAARAAAAVAAQNNAAAPPPPATHAFSAASPPNPTASQSSPSFAGQPNLPSSAQSAAAVAASQSPRPSSSASAAPSTLHSLSAQTAQLGSPALQERRPLTASSSSRRESVATTEDPKGKARAIATAPSAGSRGGSIKVEDFATNGTATPRAPPISILPESTLSASPRPLTANNAALPSPSSKVSSELPGTVEAVANGEPPRRKRQKIEYVPLSKPQTAVLGYDLAHVEEVLHQTSRRKRPRTAHDLGLVDLHSLTMSLRSRLASEVAFALNSLTLISMSIRTYPQEANAIAFPLSRCRDLYDELVDLLEETAFGDGDNEDGSGSGGECEGERGRDPEPDSDPPLGARSAHRPETYPELFEVIVERAGQISPVDPDERNRIAALADVGCAPLRPVDVVLSVTNILRNFSIAEENSLLMGQDRNLVRVLARVADLQLRAPDGEDDEVRWPIRVSAADSMCLKKDVLELVVNFGIGIRFDAHETATVRSLVDLVSFFLLDAERHGDVYFDLSDTPGSASRLGQPASVRIPHYLDLGLAAFAHVTLIDTNRAILSRLASPALLERLFDTLIRLVPVSEADFQVLTHEHGLVHVHNLVMSLYNLAFLSPPELKLALRANPAYVRSLLRVVRRLSGTGATDAAAQTFQPLLERCIAILHLLSTLEGVAMGSSGMESSQVPWWGLSMSGWEDDEDTSVGGDGTARVRPAQPSATDRGTVKQKSPPTASTAAGLDPGLPILSGETMALFESLDNRSLVNVFTSLVPLL